MLKPKTPTGDALYHHENGGFRGILREKVIYLDRNGDLAKFTFTHIWLLVKLPFWTIFRLSAREKVNLQKIKNFSGQNRTKIDLYGNNKV